MSCTYCFIAGSDGSQSVGFVGWSGVFSCWIVVTCEVGRSAPVAIKPFG